MIVRRIEIARHSVLCAAAAALWTVERPDATPQISGDLDGDIAAGPPPLPREARALVPFNSPRARRSVTIWPRPPLVLPADTSVSAVAYYPPGGAGLGWHTDYMHPGWRVYIGRPLGAPGEFLHEGGSVLDDPALATAFLITGRPAESWHALRAPGERFAIGLRFVARGCRTLRLLGLD